MNDQAPAGFDDLQLEISWRGADDAIWEQCNNCNDHGAQQQSPAQQASDLPAAARPPSSPPMIPAAPLVLPPLSQPVTTTWSVPGSKSLTNRALVLAALAEGTSTLTGCLLSDDTRHMQACLAELGIQIEQPTPTTLVVHGGRQHLQAASKPLFVGNSGTTVRFLSALAAVVPGTTDLFGDEHMAKRPIEDLVSGLQQLGVQAEAASGCPPIQVQGGRLAGGEIAIPGHRSSQYTSALLMAAVAADAPVTIRITGSLVSRPYVLMTVAMIEAFGGRVAVGPDWFRVEPVSLQPQTYAIEPDASAASYPVALALANRGRVTVPGIHRDMLQGDIGFVDVVAAAGADVTWSDDGVTVDGRNGLQGLTVDMHHISDTAQTLAAIAPLASGPLRITNVANIRIKETDRLAALVTELTRLGQGVTSGEDWLAIEPRPLTPAVVDCYADHRMAMSFAVLGASADGVSIADPACVAKTYPEFWVDLAALYPEAPW